MACTQTVDQYIDAHPEKASGLRKLRKLLLASGLEETVKWGAPCYTLEGKNVVGLLAFSGYVGLWFHQGMYLSDPLQVLINAQAGKTKALRQWRFEKPSEIVSKQVSSYIDEAIANERAGKRLKAEPKQSQAIPAELKTLLAKDAKAKQAFAALSPGKRREYAEHIASAKREATRHARAEKALDPIKQGAGLHDKYRNG